MRVLILSNYGMGLYKLRKELIQELIKQGHEVAVSLPNDRYTPLLENLGCKYFEARVDRRGTNPIADLMLLNTYLKIIKKVKPDIVLTYTIKPNVYGGIACRITKTPYIPNITGLGTAIESEGLIQKITLGLYKIGLKGAKCVFFQNEQNRQFFIERGIIDNNSKIIPGSGVNLKQHCFEEYIDEQDSIRLLFIGRVMKAKGIDELFAAAKKIKEDNKKVEFHIVGFCEEGYSDQLRELNDSGIIVYHGQQDDVHKYIKDSHATILPSYHEGTSNVLLESASTGRPILASNVTGCKETFDEGISGFGFEVKSVEALVDTIKKFIELPFEMKKQMGLAGRKKMELEYDREIVINAYVKEINKE
jgi:glycosyltransferase involved in cell wall biosynthesis